MLMPLSAVGKMSSCCRKVTSINCLLIDVPDELVMCGGMYTVCVGGSSVGGVNIMFSCDGK